MKKSDKPENTRTMTVYAVIDTNVIVSALYSKKPDTAPLLILENLFDGNIVPIQRMLYFTKSQCPRKTHT